MLTESSLPCYTINSDQALDFLPFIGMENFLSMHVLRLKSHIELEEPLYFLIQCILIDSSLACYTITADQDLELFSGLGTLYLSDSKSC